MTTIPNTLLETEVDVSAFQKQPKGPPRAHLLGLPRELRDLITEHIILKPTNTITMLPNFGCHANEISACPPSICSVSHQIRAETLPTFYSANIFTAQLDNDQDLETAKSWLEAIGDANVRHLRKLVMCGWTRVPFAGEGMVSRRWIRVGLDLREGTLTMESHDGDYAAIDCPSEVANTIDELKRAYAQMVEARKGRPFDVKCVAELMDGFNMLCTGY